MCEIERVILNKKYIVLVLSLFAVNLAIFQYYQVDALSKINSEEHLGVFAGELFDCIKRSFHVEENSGWYEKNAK